MQILEDMREEFCSRVLEFILDNECSIDEIVECVPDVPMGVLYGILDDLEEEGYIVHDVEEDMWKSL